MEGFRTIVVDPVKWLLDVGLAAYCAAMKGEGRRNPEKLEKNE
jgi:hypothetical protein